MYNVQIIVQLEISKALQTTCMALLLMSNDCGQVLTAHTCTQWLPDA